MVLGPGTLASWRRVDTRLLSQTTIQEGWVKDPEGKRQLRLYAHWRSDGNDMDWFEEVTTMWLKNPSDLVVIKF